MSDLKAKLAALKAKQISVSKPAPKPAAPVAQPTLSTAQSSNMDSLLKRTGNLTDKVIKHLESQEAKGLYSLVGDTSNLDGFDSDEFLRNLRNLDEATVEKSPDIRRFSMLIRKNLEQYPELPHILSDEQLGIITSGILTLAGVETEPKSAAGKTKSAAKKIEALSMQDVDDLFAKS